MEKLQGFWAYQKKDIVLQNAEEKPQFFIENVDFDTDEQEFKVTAKVTIPANGNGTIRKEYREKETAIGDHLLTAYFGDRCKGYNQKSFTFYGKTLNNTLTEAQNFLYNAEKTISAVKENNRKKIKSAKEKNIENYVISLEV